MKNLPPGHSFLGNEFKGGGATIPCFFKVILPQMGTTGSFQGGNQVNGPKMLRTAALSQTEPHHKKTIDMK